MKIKYAILSSDDNRLYLDFWPIVSELWKRKLGITPILVYFGNNLPGDIRRASPYGAVIKREIIPDIPVYVQCQWARYHMCCELDDVCIISDIDMLPLSKFYFVDQIKDIPDDRYVHLNPCLDTYPNIPACYHVAHSDTYREVLGNQSDFETSMINALKGSADMNTAADTRKYWFVDEKYSTLKINQYPDKSIFEFIQRDGGQNGHRIDRPDWRFDLDKIRQDWYYDCHSARPYSQYKADVDLIKNTAING